MDRSNPRRVLHSVSPMSMEMFLKNVNKQRRDVQEYYKCLIRLSDCLKCSLCTLSHPNSIDHMVFNHFIEG